MTSENRGTSPVWKGKDLEVEVAVAPEPPDFAMRAIRLDLTRPKTDEATYQLGPSVRLRFGEGHTRHSAHKDRTQSHESRNLGR
jgi:hypothetical protein